MCVHCMYSCDMYTWFLLSYDGVFVLFLLSLFASSRLPKTFSLRHYDQFVLIVAGIRDNALIGMGTLFMVMMLRCVNNNNNRNNDKVLYNCMV